MSAIHIFIAYARKDKSYWEELNVHLRSIDRKPNIEIWYDGLILPGEEWEESIKAELYKADIILLLMSANSLNSDYFFERELKKALEQHQSGKSIVIPVILTYCQWKDPDLQLVDLQALPKDGVPIIEWNHESKAYNDIAEGVRKSIQVVKAKRKNAKEKEERERRAVELARQRKIKEARKKARLEALQKEKEEKERLKRIADRKEKEKGERLRKEQVAVAKRIQEENAANKLLELEETKRKKDTEIPPMTNVRPEKSSSWGKMGIGSLTLLFLLIWGISNFTGMSEEEKIVQIQKLIDDMVLVKGGTFTMGCLPKRDGECQDDELPAHKVTLSDYKIGKYEVTQAQYEAVTGKKPSHFSSCKNCPVENISWNDAQIFIQKLNQKTGKNFRLPTEAEWEFAARGGNESKGYKYGGGNELEEVAWCDGKTHLVGGKKSNELGLYDMSGNVEEWCEDGYASYNYSSFKYLYPKDTSVRIVRSDPYGLSTYRVASRGFTVTPTNRFILVGFRLAQ